jgi:hypothetical protein
MLSGAEPTRSDAARVLTAAVYAVTRESGNARDWLIGGAMDVRGDAQALRGLAPAGLTPRLAWAESGEGLVHLRGTRSSVDGLYVPAGYLGLESSDDEDGRVIAGQPLPEMLRGLSPHPLVAVRVSLADQVPERALPTDVHLGALDRTLDELSQLDRWAIEGH